MRLSGLFGRALQLDEQSYQRRVQIYGTDHLDSLSTFGGINLDRRELGRLTSRRTRTRRPSSPRPAGCCGTTTTRKSCGRATCWRLPAQSRSPPRAPGPESDLAAPLQYTAKRGRRGTLARHANILHRPRLDRASCAPPRGEKAEVRRSRFSSCPARNTRARAGGVSDITVTASCLRRVRTGPGADPRAPTLTSPLGPSHCPSNRHPDQPSRADHYSFGEHSSAHALK